MILAYLLHADAPCKVEQLRDVAANMERLDEHMENVKNARKVKGLGLTAAQVQFLQSYPAEHCPQDPEYTESDESDDSDESDFSTDSDEAEPTALQLQEHFQWEYVYKEWENMKPSLRTTSPAYKEWQKLKPGSGGPAAAPSRAPCPSVPRHAEFKGLDPIPDPGVSEAWREWKEWEKHPACAFRRKPLFIVAQYRQRLQHAAARDDDPDPDGDSEDLSEAGSMDTDMLNAFVKWPAEHQLQHLSTVAWPGQC